jgi:hypothetical protein
VCIYIYVVFFDQKLEGWTRSLKGALRRHPPSPISSVFILLAASLSNKTATWLFWLLLFLYQIFLGKANGYSERERLSFIIIRMAFYDCSWIPMGFNH